MMILGDGSFYEKTTGRLSSVVAEAPRAIASAFEKRRIGQDRP
jgi:hypothetical protein